MIRRNELQYSEPPEVLGRGTFGLVFLAEYRGTHVAVKRVIPPKPSETGSVGVKSYKGSQAWTSSAYASDLEAQIGSSQSVDLIGPEQASNGSKSQGPDKQANANGKSKRGLGKSTASMNADYTKLKDEFLDEMRELAKLRHPCITTVMGAVLEKNQEPLLVMEHMDHGSLYDLLHNKTMDLDGEIILPILRDIAQGVRFLVSTYLALSLSL